MSTLAYPILAFLAWKAICKLKRAWSTLSEPSSAPGVTAQPESWPAVVVQLPLYNERKVVTHLLRSVARLDYPSDGLHVQVLDDSDDATSALVARQARYLRRRGLHIDHLRRTHREGFKAGALANGLQNSTAPFVALFDADFVVPPDFLRRVLPAFAQEKLAAAQGRWGYLNRNANLMTRLQAQLPCSFLTPLRYSDRVAMCGPT